MKNVILHLWKDDDGFVVSAELVLIATIAVLAIVVGLSEVSLAVNQELNDVANGFGTVNQGFRYQGLTGHGGVSNGTSFGDAADFCDTYQISTTAPTPEGGNS